MRQSGEQWVEVIEGERHLVMEVKSDKEHAACPRCMFNGGHGTCVYPEDDCPVRNGHYIKDLGILNENGCLPCPLCGGYPRLAMYDEKTNYYAYCNDCGTCIGERVYPTEQEAIDAWNRRV